MNQTLEFLVRHGAAVLFASVFVEQLGVPLPAAPWLLAAGALAATGKMLGGIDAWRERNYPTDPREVGVTSLSDAGSTMNT